MSQEKNPLNQWRGKVSRAAGKLFESYIEASCNYYLERGEADIEKTPEPFNILRKLPDGTFIVKLKKKAQPDFKGTQLGGKTFVFEAKHTDESRIEQNRLTSEQWNRLKKHHELGADSFVLVSIRFEKFSLVPWKVWEGMKELYGRRYMTVEELKPFQVPFRNNVIRFLDKAQW